MAKAAPGNNHTKRYILPGLDSYMNLQKIIDQNKLPAFHMRYPQFDTTDDKIHVLYFFAHANATGFYRYIFPSIELNKTTTHSAIVAFIEPYSHIAGKSIDDVEIQLDQELIAWADYIVFPAIATPLDNIIQHCRKINKKAHLQFVMDLDDNYGEVPPAHPLYLQLKQTNQIILRNMDRVDVVTCTCQNLINYYAEKIKRNPEFYCIPNYMHLDAHVPERVPQKKNKILISLNPSQLADINEIKPALLEIHRKRDDFEIVMWGWNGISKGFNPLRSVKKTYKPTVSFIDYFTELNNIGAHAAIMPLADTEFNRCKSNHKFLQFCAQGIIPIASNISTYYDFSENLYSLPCSNKNEWIEHIDFALDNDLSAEKNNNINEVKKHTISANVNTYTNCYI